MTKVVRYRTTPESADENQALIEAVFAELAADPPQGLTYLSVRLDDGVTFVHLAEITTEDGANPLSTCSAFAAFQHDLPARCEEPPVVTDAQVIGRFDPARA